MPCLITELKVLAINKTTGEKNKQQNPQKQKQFVRQKFNI